MKTKLLSAIALATSLSVPLFAHAQSNEPVTRASVRAELVQLEQAGYRPEDDRINYPMNLQKAERRIHADQYANSSGSSVAGSSASGSRAHVSTNSNDSNWNPNPVDNHPGA